ncbi:MAG: hypothetical protein R6W70_04180 [bacterium]
MKKKILELLVISLAVFVMAVSCGDVDNEDNKDSNENELNDDNNENPDREQNDDSVVVEDLTYPGDDSSSSKVSGEIARNFIFYDIEGNKRALAEFYQKRTLIWLMFGTYTCPYCMDELEYFPEIYKEEYVEQGFEIISVIAGGYNEPNDLESKKEGIAYEHGEKADWVWGYLDSSNTNTVFLTYSPEGAVPINVLIDGRTMEIVQYFQGNQINPMNEEKRIEYWLKKLK